MELLPGVRGPARGRLRLVFGLVVSLAAVTVSAGELALDLRGAGHYTSNLNNAESSQIRQEDFVFEVDVIGDYRQSISESSGLVLKFGLETDKHADNTDLDAITGMASLGIVMQSDRGFTAPWFALFGDFRWREHASSDIRDGSLITVGAAAGKRFTDRLSGQLRYEYLSRNATRDRVFDLNQHGLSTVLDFRATEDVNLYFKHEYRNGGLVTSSPMNPKFRGVNRAFARDPAFGRSFLAWRLDGHANSFRAGGKYKFAKRTALDGGVTYSHATASNDNKWDVWRVGLSLAHRFK